METLDAGGFETTAWECEIEINQFFFHLSIHFKGNEDTTNKHVRGVNCKQKPRRANMVRGTHQAFIK